MKVPPTIDQLRAALTYDPDTGVFRWLPGRHSPGTVAGTSPPHRYVRIHLAGKMRYAHQLAVLWMTEEWPASDVDHRNGDIWDNRWSNLRVATRAQNMQNVVAPQSNNLSGRRGVTFEKRRSHWVARIVVDGRCRYLGSFGTAEEAAAAHLAAKAALHSFFARTDAADEIERLRNTPKES